MQLSILHVISSAALSAGGPSRVVRELTAELAERGHQVQVLSGERKALMRGGQGKHSPLDIDFHPLVKHHVFPFNLDGPPWPSFRLLTAFQKQLKGVDVVHVHGLFNLSCSFAMLMARQQGVPYFLRTCGMLDSFCMAQKGFRKRPWWRFIDGPSAGAAYAIQCSTPHEMQDVKKALLQHHFNADHLHELPQGVNALPPPLEHSPFKKPYLLSLGRVAPKKGILPLLQALALNPNFPDLVIIGPSEEGHLEELQKEAKRLGISFRVHFLPPVYDLEEKATWYAHAEAFCLTSFDENFGLTVIEAAQQGTALLLSDRVGLHDAVRDMHAGMVCSTAPEDIASQLEKLLEDPKRFQKGAIKLAKNYTWGEQVDRLLVLYREATRERLMRRK